MLVVEHDEQMMRAADWLVDMGPGAGEHGGFVIAEGPAAKVERNAKSITGQFLSGARDRRARAAHGRSRVVLGRGASSTTSRGSTSSSRSKLVCVTGVSGSGKSTLVNEIVFKALANRLNRLRVKPGEHVGYGGSSASVLIIDIDQSPIGRTPRSNPATYELFDHIRELYSLTPEAKVRGYKPGRFSFNVRGGRCETCKGDGTIKIEMHFLPDVYVPCETCHGRRYNRETLEVRFKGKSIADVLEMSGRGGAQLLRQDPQAPAPAPDASRRWSRLHQARSAGDDALRRRGAARQACLRAVEGRDGADAVHPRRADDRPALRRHREAPLEVLQRLVDNGSTVLVIEHNLDVINERTGL